MDSKQNYHLIKLSHMSGNIDALIRNKETELQPLLSRMEEIRLQFVYDVTRFASEWYEEKAREYATKKPEITLSLGKEKLAQMKVQVNELVRNTSKIVDESLTDPEVWWHKTPRVNASPSAYEQLGNDQVGNKFPEVLDKAIRWALGELGNVLEQFGYGVTTGALKASYPEFWFKSKDGLGSGVHPFFPHLFEWSSEMQDTIAKYDVVYKKAIVLFNEITMLKEEKKRIEAKALWDNA